MSDFEVTLPGLLIRDAVQAALREDLGFAGDITTDATIPASSHIEAEITARAPGIIAGVQLAETTFRELDRDIRIEWYVRDGGAVKMGSKVAKIRGPARPVLTGERVALNFLGHLSGIATMTGAYVERTKGTKAAICCTRKTTPGLRAFEKFAVRAGGGENHRFGLNDAVLIKDNHIAAAGGIDKAIERCIRSVGHMVKIEVEVDSLDQLEKVLAFSVDAVLLDNMSPADLERAVGMIDGRCLAEASGGVTLDRVAEIAASGVDLISVGALTHSAPVLDLGLDIARLCS